MEMCLLYDGFFLLPSCGRFLLILFQKRRCFCLCHCSRFNFCISIVFKGIEQFFLCIKWAYSRDEKLVVLYCKQLGINYKNLSDEEFRWLIRILKKSKKMGTPISQRKKR